jgi:hypothetical protein
MRAASDRGCHEKSRSVSKKWTCHTDKTLTIGVRFRLYKNAGTALERHLASASAEAFSGALVRLVACYSALRVGQVVYESAGSRSLMRAEWSVV